ncbi:ATP synthase F1 subcomplex epsilon subunit [Rhodoblastus acidophilus]|uniref:ATP synthase epsilon chain n=1 Tax=Rhodoblastus acidophilus TaxID=1074 RepID=A0A212RM34_RHOAC|nr:F0F1 ATP synthase subunit epsilon [Rhodoblastus acidophilus]MCW2315772.1 F-type H+-transporting ATPase subunit epsilon [Rhodoblastus acidophilus]PPQ39140.1 F0F1 ATP synthase subunit epsilon [Rhodoblastus acidophilus]RAI24153.1 F0F1 ATP synthase subunit epsilon [Rhodoblastus acidophilus]SNB73562.1 ATP synthase F1 subcomplex epsilon subunit [Rhodoblastus acidophilus]
MATFHFELVSPEKLLYSGDVEAVVVPGAEGLFTVMKDHAPAMAVLKAGVVEIDETANKKTKLFVRGGFADVASGGLTILAEYSKPLAEFDAAQLAQEIKNAEEDLADAKTEEAKKTAAAKIDQLNELKSAVAA